MRIIAGEARGRRLIAPAGDETRPTSDKLRGALFNILSNCVFDSHVLDLFGGTGAMALEALSRGAVDAVIVDKSRDAIRCIRENAQKVLGDACENRALILPIDYRQAIARVQDRKFDLVFLDPPYRMRDAYADALIRLREAGSLAEDAIIVLEYAEEIDVTLPDGCICYDERRYGAARIKLVREAKLD